MESKEYRQNCQKLILQTSQIRINGINWELTKRWRKKLRPYCVIHFTQHYGECSSSPPEISKPNLDEEKWNPPSAQCTKVVCPSPPSKAWSLEKSNLLQSHARYSPLHSHARYNPTKPNYVSDEEISPKQQWGFRGRNDNFPRKKEYLKSLGGGVRQRSASADKVGSKRHPSPPKLFGWKGYLHSDIQAWPCLTTTSGSLHESNITIEVHNKVVLPDGQPYSQPSSPIESDLEEETHGLWMSHPQCLGSIEIALADLVAGKEANEEWYQVPLNVCLLSTSKPGPGLHTVEEKPQVIWAEIQISAYLQKWTGEDGNSDILPPRQRIQQSLLNASIAHGSQTGRRLRPDLLLENLSSQKLETLRGNILRFRWKDALRFGQDRLTSQEEPGDSNQQLRDLFWLTIPNEMKEEVCMRLSGAEKEKSEAGNGYYQTLIHQITHMEAQMNGKSLLDRESLCGKPMRLESKSSRSTAHTHSMHSLGDTSNWSQDAFDVYVHHEILGKNELSGSSDSEKDYEVPHSEDHSSEEQIGVYEGPSNRPTENSEEQEFHSISDTRSDHQDFHRVGDDKDEILDDWVDVDYMSPVQDFGRVWREIELDLPRTFGPQGPQASAESSEGQAALRRVLRVFAQRNPRVGYCQGLNFLAGALLSAFSEESTFWLLVTLCEKINPGYYDPTMKVARADTAALKVILSQELPDLSLHIEALGLPLELIYTQWLLVHFVNVLPNRSALRVLELVFAEGSPAVTMAVAVAFFRLHREALLAKGEMQDLVEYINTALGEVWDADALLEEARVIFCSPTWQSRLEQLRKWHLDLQATDTIKHTGSWGELVGRCTFQYTSTLLEDGRLGKSPLAPLMLRGLQWAMGWK